LEGASGYLQIRMTANWWNIVIWTKITIMKESAQPNEWDGPWTPSNLHRL
jgi:hypothetical protein